MKTIITAFSFLLLLSLSLVSCKKDGSSPSRRELVGEWRELGLNRSLRFKRDQTFQFSVDHGDGSGTVIAGTYKTEGDSLEITAQKMLQQLPGQSLKWETANHTLYENATFDIFKDVLTLKYTTYPADAPLPTTAKFQRQIVIDNGGLVH